MIHRAALVLKLFGTVLLFAACGIGIYSGMEDYFAGERARLMLEEMQALPSVSPERTDSASVNFNEQMDASGPEERTEPAPAQTVPAQLKLGYDTIGVLTIPRLGLELPILSECTENALAVSICRYLGTWQGKPERLVVAGHNYKRHFGSLHKLVAGDEVLFTNSAGTVYRYAVTGILEISGNDHIALEAGKWDMTLLTCSSDRSKRILVRCREVR